MKYFSPLRRVTQIAVAGCFVVAFFFPHHTLAVTRFYIANTAADETLPAVQGTWTDSTSATTGLLGAKTGVAATKGVASSATGVNVLIGRWMSLPLSANTSFATTDTVTYTVGALVSSVTNTTVHFRVHIYVVAPDGTTIRGTLLNNSTGAGTAFTATATGRTDNALNLSNNVSALAGDRIVVEVGYNRTGSSAASRTITYNYGNTGATDLVSGSTAVTTNPGWFEFSTTFTAAGSAPTVATNAATGVGNTTAILNGNITDAGGLTESARGFAWGTNSSLSGGDTSTTTESGSFSTGAFTQSLTNLISNTKYYFRAYGTDSQGTGIGTSIQNFTTSVDTTPARKIRLFAGYRLRVNNGGRIIINKN